MKINERQLRQIIRESVKKVLKESKLNEVSGWKLEDDDLTLVNDKSCGDKLYIVKLWWGSGYMMDCYNAFASSEEEALNYVVTYIEENYPEYLDKTDKYAESLIHDLSEEHPEMDECELEELPEFNETFRYVDATMEGANMPHYIWFENLQVAEYPKNHNYPINHNAR